MAIILLINGKRLKTLEELRENFNLAELIKRFHGGQLRAWLHNWEFETELEQVEALPPDLPDSELAEALCRIFGIVGDVKEQTFRELNEEKKRQEMEFQRQQREDQQRREEERRRQQEEQQRREEERRRQQEEQQRREEERRRQQEEQQRREEERRRQQEEQQRREEEQQRWEEELRRLEEEEQRSRQKEWYRDGMLIDYFPLFKKH